MEQDSASVCNRSAPLPLHQFRLDLPISAPLSNITTHHHDAIGSPALAVPSLIVDSAPQTASSSSPNFSSPYSPFLRPSAATPLRISLASSLPPAPSTSTTHPVVLPWWRRVLGALWMGTKMCVMVSLMSILWVILAVPTIDQHLQALFRWFCRSIGLPRSHDDASSPAKPATTTRRRSAPQQATSRALEIRFGGEEDENTCATIIGSGSSTSSSAKPRLSGSQELRKSEEGDNDSNSCEQQEDKLASSTTTSLSSEEAKADVQEGTKTKRKRIVKSVRWSDDAIQSE